MANNEQKKKVRKKSVTIIDNEKAERINLIEQMILQGLKLTDVFKIVTAPIESKGLGWDVTRRTVYNYYRMAKKRVTRLISESELKAYMRQTLKRYELLFSQSQKIKDYKTCNAINKNIADLLQLGEYSKQILDVTDKSEVTIEVIDFD